MKKFSLGFLLCISLTVVAQKDIAPTESFTIEGLVIQSKTISLSDLSAYTVKQKDSVIITNHLLERKSVLMNVKGVLLKDILATLKLKEENPKLFSEFYFVCIAADNYKVVFSWNELFNTETGNNAIIITEQNGKQATEAPNRIALISYGDKATGRRYVKSLQKILVERVK
ncbi:MAG: molybdopterin-binding protein [Ferruginibacter sp.]